MIYLHVATLLILFVWDNGRSSHFRGPMDNPSPRKLSRSNQRLSDLLRTRLGEGTGVDGRRLAGEILQYRSEKSPARDTESLIGCLSSVPPTARRLRFIKASTHLDSQLGILSA